MAEEKLLRWRQFPPDSLHWLGFRVAPDSGERQIVFSTGDRAVASRLLEWGAIEGPEGGPGWRTVFLLPPGEVNALAARVPDVWRQSSMAQVTRSDLRARFGIPKMEEVVEEIAGAGEAALYVDAARNRWIATEHIARPDGFGPVPGIMLPPEWTLRVADPESWARTGRTILRETLDNPAGAREWTLADIRQRARLMAEDPDTPVPAGAVLPPAGPDATDEEREARAFAAGELLRGEVMRAASRRVAVADYNESRRLDRLIAFSAETDIPPVMAWAIRSVLSETETGSALARATAHRPGADPALAPTLVTLGLSPQNRETAPSNDNAEAPRFLDLRHLEPAAAAETATAELAFREQRNGNGALILMLPGRAETNADFRERLGRRRGIEACLDIPPGFSGLAAATLIAVGEVRPEALGAAPPQALRVQEATRAHDLHLWRSETIRQRDAISRWHAGDQEVRLTSRPYAPISRVGRTVTMVPDQLAEPTRAAGAALAASLPNESVDEFVGQMLGIDMSTEDGRQDLETRFQAEQVDAIAFAAAAWRKGRGFLLADQTGVGKGRSLAGAATAWLRQNPEHRVMYVTASAGNLSDVMRDMEATGCLAEPGSPPVMMANEVALRAEQVAVLPTDTERKNLLASCAWPGADLLGARGEESPARILCTTYSTFARDEIELAARGRDWPNRRWLDAVTDDPNLLVIMDECHRALNPKSRTGEAFRQAARQAGAVLFASATPLRDHRGINLYARLLPAGIEIPEMGVEASQTLLEAVSALLVEDGVMLRRDHDYSDVEFVTHLPAAGSDEERIAIEAMDGLRPVIRAMLDLHDAVAAAVHVPLDGTPRVHVPHDMFAAHFGGPLTAATSLVISALKVESTARLAARDLEEGRKPMIALTATGGTFLDHLHDRQQAAREDADGAELPPMDREAIARPDIRDALRRIGERMYRQERGGETVDLALLDDRVADAARVLEQRIQAFPVDLTASPIDDLKRRIGELTGRGAESVGEVTGRERQLDADGTVVPRDPTNRIATIDAYNSGELDVLIYNAAGGVGFSYHASAAFADQRPRTILQLEPTLDAVEFIQGLGRGNRFGQVAPPRIVSVGSGLVPETRLMGLLARKLRSLGAAVDSDRHHPLLNPDYPDLVNIVGDGAAFEVLRRDPRTARELGLEAAQNAAWDRYPNLAREMAAGTRAAPNEVVTGWSSRVLSRTVLLTNEQQQRLLDDISDEFDTRVAALDERGENPLEVRRLEGHFVPAGPPQPLNPQHDEEADSDLSVFQRPLMVVTGHQHSTRGIITGQQVVEAAEETRRLMTQDRSPAAWAARLRAVAPMQAELFQPGEAGADPETTRRQRAAELLEQIEPGTLLTNGSAQEAVTDFIPPADGIRNGQLRGFELRLVRPGDSRPRAMTLHQALSLYRDGNLTIGENLLDTDTGSWVEAWDAAAGEQGRRPIQLVTGNVFAVVNLQTELKSETEERASAAAGQRARIGLWSVTHQDGMRQRALVNLTPKVADLASHPFPIRPEAWLRGGRRWVAEYHDLGRNPAAGLAAEVETKRQVRGQERRDRSAWTMKVFSDRANNRHVPRLICTLSFPEATRSTPAEDLWRPFFRITRPNGRDMTREEWAQWQVWPGPALWPLINNGAPLPADKPENAWTRASWALSDPRCERILQLMDRHPWMAQSFMPGLYREWVRHHATLIAERPETRVLDHGDPEMAQERLARLLERETRIGDDGQAVDLMHAHDRSGRQVRVTRMNAPARVVGQGDFPDLRTETLLFAHDPASSTEPDIPGIDGLADEMRGAPLGDEAALRLARDLAAAGYTITMLGGDPEPEAVPDATAAAPSSMAG